ncbi:AraC-like DNA-binding protein [Nocardioides sp. BE266]|uniref:AraC family transcriptional regulator n=1 Tax=Nocardioides sp. BE266 TaxID=2817725 RepID=UPI0028629F6C|nr:AraC family transcriptional regulator [Nocardioides sp. BE266]MDR7254828.1 AraC-like DNA-binding protein [Nocardioides sp. BE266]
MPESGSRRGSPAAFDFEGEGDDARQWLDHAYGTTLRLTGAMGSVRHSRADHGALAFDVLHIDGRIAFDSDPMPALVVVDLLGGTSEYTRDHRTDRVHDGDTLLMSGWDMPFTGTSDRVEVRATTLTAEVVTQAVEDVVLDYPWEHVSFSSYVPRTPAAGAQWRATVDQLSRDYPGARAPLARSAASRLLGHTLLQTFPNNVVTDDDLRAPTRDLGDVTSATLRRAVRVIEARAHEDLSMAELARECGITPRGLQYAFRRHLGCTPMAYLRRVRLDLVRQALRDGSSVTVGEAAGRFGFHNAGRFATGYRELFDENPRDTLHRSHT